MQLGFPEIIFWAVTPPLYQKLASAAPSTAVQDGLHLLLLNPFKHRGRRSMGPTFLKGVRGQGLQEGGMEDRVDLVSLSL